MDAEVLVFPEMPPEPPPEYVAFVVRRLGAAQAEAGRLTGGDRYADEVYPAALADVATRWRWRRLRPFDEERLLARRLAVHAKRWREEQIYPVEVVAVHTGRRPVPRFVSVALRKAGLLPPTARPQQRPAAEAAIAWAAAYRRYVWRRRARIAATVVLVLFAISLLLPTPPT
jgi:hypothetical protein